MLENNRNSLKMYETKEIAIDIYKPMWYLLKTEESVIYRISYMFETGS